MDQGAMIDLRGTGAARDRGRGSSEAGLAMVETLLGATIVLVVAVGLLPLGIVATSLTENEGRLAARTTEYAQDKLEHLLALAFGDTTTDTTVVPAAATDGTGLSVGGGVDPTAPVAGYVDYLDANGVVLPSGGGIAPAGWAYARLWQITSPAAGMKQIRVTVVSAVKIGSIGRRPQSTLTTLKAFPF